MSQAWCPCGQYIGREGQWCKKCDTQVCNECFDDVHQWCNECVDAEDLANLAILKSQSEGNAAISEVDALLNMLHQRYVGTEVRGQKVGMVGIECESLPRRYFVRVYFREPAHLRNQVTPTDRLMAVIDNDVPPWADVLCETATELWSLAASGCAESCWRLEDESRGCAQ